MRAETTKADEWATHLGGMLAFAAGFASIYILCGAVASGFDALQALLIDLGILSVGLIVWGGTKLRRLIVERLMLSHHTSVGATFARKDSAPTMAHMPGTETRMARPLTRPGHPLNDVGMPVPA